MERQCYWSLFAILQHFLSERSLCSASVWSRGSRVSSALSTIWPADWMRASHANIVIIVPRTFIQSTRQSERETSTLNTQSWETNQVAELQKQCLAWSLYWWRHHKENKLRQIFLISGLKDSPPASDKRQSSSRDIGKYGQCVWRRCEEELAGENWGGEGVQTMVGHSGGLSSQHIDCDRQVWCQLSQLSVSGVSGCLVSRISNY